MLGTFLSWLGSGAVTRITDRIGDAYEAKLRAETSEQKLLAEKQIYQLEAQREVLIAEQGRWYTAWIRPALAFPVVSLVWKIVLWDTVLGWGVTQNPGELVNWIVVSTIGAYFLTRPFERK